MRSGRLRSPDLNSTRRVSTVSSQTGSIREASVKRYPKRRADADGRRSDRTAYQGTRGRDRSTGRIMRSVSQLPEGDCADRSGPRLRERLELSDVVQEALVEVVRQ